MKSRTVIAVLFAHLRIWGYQLIGHTGKIRPYKLLIQLTNDCNSRCKTCDIWKINKKDPNLKNYELKASDYEGIFKQIGNDLVWLSFSGGEISLVENIDDIIKLSVRHCPRLRLITFTTNGLLPEKIVGIANCIKAFNKEPMVILSLDGDEQLHDKIRGVKGNYAKVMECFERLKKLRFNVQLGLTLNMENAGFVLQQKNREFLVKTKSISILHDQGIYQRSNLMDDSLLLEALRRVIHLYKIRSLGEIIEYCYLRYGLNFIRNERQVLPVKCTVGLTSLHVMANGDLGGCMYLPPIGNLKKNTWAEIVSQEALSRIQEKSLKGDCPKCWMNCYAPHSIMHNPLSIMKGLLGKL